MACTTPPSARNAAPLVADDNGLQTKATSAATSSTRAKRFSSDEGRTLRKNSFSTSSRLIFRAAAICSDECLDAFRFRGARQNRVDGNVGAGGGLGQAARNGKLRGLRHAVVNHFRWEFAARIRWR